MEKDLEKLTSELETRGEIYIRAKVHPNSSHTEFKEMQETPEGPTLKIDVKGVPEKGKANTELIRFLQKNFKAHEVKIISGAGERVKLIKVIK